MTDARAEPLRHDVHGEIERVRFRIGGDEASRLLIRLPRERDLETRLLPFLARRTQHAPRIDARGIPPPLVPAPSWILVEDTHDLPRCEDAGDVAAAKAAVERAVARHRPALRALGVPERPPAWVAGVAREAGAAEVDLRSADSAAARLADWPEALVHGDLVPANAVRAGDRSVLVGWRWAHLGCPLLDLVRLAGSAAAASDAAQRYGEVVGRTVGVDDLRAAEVLEGVFARYVRD